MERRPGDGRTQGPDVGGRARVAPAPQHLGRHVVGRAARRLQHAVRARAVRQRAQPKVAQLHVACAVQQHVLRLQVPARGAGGSAPAPAAPRAASNRPVASAAGKPSDANETGPAPVEDAAAVAVVEPVQHLLEDLARDGLLRARAAGAGTAGRRAACGAPGAHWAGGARPWGPRTRSCRTARRPAGTCARRGASAPVLPRLGTGPRRGAGRGALEHHVDLVARAHHLFQVDDVGVVQVTQDGDLPPDLLQHVVLPEALAVEHLRCAARAAQPHARGPEPRARQNQPGAP